MKIQLSDSNDLYKGTAQGEEVLGGRGDDVIKTGKGNDTINGEQGNDELRAGAGDDSVFDGGIQGRDTLIGGGGNDTLSSVGGRDTLIGGTGDDFLSSGGGLTTATGGAGNDEFGFVFGAFTNSESMARTNITDFNVQEDKIVSQTESDQFSDLEFSGNRILGASTGNVVFVLEGVDTSELTANNFGGFVGSFHDVLT